MSRLPLAFALILGLATTTRSEFDAVVSQAPHKAIGYPPSSTIFVVASDGHDLLVSLRGRTRVCWRFDDKVDLPPEALRVGTRVHISGPQHAPLIEVLSLGPCEMAAAVEQWVVAATVDRPDARASFGQVLSGERQPIVNAAPGTDLCLSAAQIATIEALGSRSWLVREAVTKELRSRNVSVFRLLIWASYAPDPEIRRRAIMLLNELGWPN